jgi:predicted ATPase
MITQIELSNFKCFKEITTFPLSKINLLTGINGRGKSTLLQSLLLMRQTIEHDERSTEIVFNGSCVRLGAFEDVKNSEISIHEPITMSYKCKNEMGEELMITYFLIKNTDNELIGNISKITTDYISHEDISEISFLKDKKKYSIIEEDTTIQNEANCYLNILALIDPLNGGPANMFAFDSYDLSDNAAKFHRTHYIAADRIGPKDYYAKNNLGEFVNVGPQGENTAIVLARKQENIVYDDLYLGENAKTVLQQTEEWLNKIFDGAKIDLVVERNIISITYNTKPTEKRYKASNVGFGYSYILPIIVSGLIAQKDEILIIENPEAHLHPKAQSQLTKFLAKVASCGVQVYIESHSEHILNALRVVSLDDTYSITNEDISVLYFKDDTEQPFIKLNIEKDGSIKNWVDGFFDQQELDLSEIFKLSKGRK